MKVKLKGISARAKNRIKEHGDTFNLVEANSEKILVESLGKTFNKNTELWLGWFDRNEIVTDFNQFV